MKSQIIWAPLLAGLGGLWMVLSGAMMHRGWRMMPMHGQWSIEQMWGHSLMGLLWGWWPWLGVIAGAIIVVSAIVLYLAPQYRHSLGITILLLALVNLFFGMGGIVSTAFALFGGVMAITRYSAAEK